MSTLYRPVPVTSVEQLEALPEGGFIYVTRSDGRVSDYNRTPVGWFGKFPPEEGDTVHALVPVEVRVEGHRIYEGAKTIEATYYIHEETP